MNGLRIHIHNKLFIERMHLKDRLSDKVGTTVDRFKAIILNLKLFDEWNLSYEEATS